MQAFDRHAKRRQLGEQRSKIVARVIRAQQRITEHAGRDWCGTDAFLLRPRLRRLGEVEPFEFEPAHRYDAKPLGAFQHALQDLAPIEREWLVAAVFLHDEFAEKEIHAIVPGNVSMRGEIEPRQRIGKALVPAGQRRVVIPPSTADSNLSL